MIIFKGLVSIIVFLGLGVSIGMFIERKISNKAIRELEFVLYSINRKDAIIDLETTESYLENPCLCRYCQESDRQEWCKQCSQLFKGV